MAITVVRAMRIKPSDNCFKHQSKYLKDTLCKSAATQWKPVSLLWVGNISSRHQECGIQLSGLERLSFSYISMIKFRFFPQAIPFLSVIVHSPVHHFWQFWFVIWSLVLNDVISQLGPIYYPTFAFYFYTLVHFMMFRLVQCRRAEWNIFPPNSTT